MIIFNKCSDLYSLLSKVRNLFMWNIYLSFYLGDYSELQLNAMIEMREHAVSSLYSRISLALSIIIVVSYTLLIIYMLYILNRKRRTPVSQKNRPRLRWYTEEGPEVKKASNSKLNLTFFQEQFCEIPQGVAIITEDFVSKNTFTKNFFLIMLIQNFLLILLIFFFQDYGLVQAIVYTILTMFFVIIIAWQRPYKSKKSKVQLTILLINQCSKVAMGIIAIMIGGNEQTNSIPQIAISQIVIVIMINLVIGLLITAV